MPRSEIQRRNRCSRAAYLWRQFFEVRGRKHNVGDGAAEIPSDAAVVLELGEVESDRLTVVGSPNARSNAELLRRARRHHLNTFTVYMPLSGRRGCVLQWCG